MNAFRTTPKLPAPSLRRRTLLKAGAVGALSAGPWVISSSTRASSGELNLLVWGDYLPAEVQEEFSNRTGIRINLVPVDSADDVLNKMKASRGEGFDICSTSAMRSGAWADLELLQPWLVDQIDELENVNRRLIQIGSSAWNFEEKGSHWLPHLWGSEGIGWRVDRWKPGLAGPSYGDVWAPENANKSMIRIHSGLLGAGLFMEASGDLEAGSVWAAYRSEARMRRTWEEILAFTAARKRQLRLLWTDTQTQKRGFNEEDVALGQVWDRPAVELAEDNKPVRYQAPVEGALVWVDGLSLSAAARNVPQAYAFIRFCYDRKAAGMGISSHGYNSAVLGAEKYATVAYQQNFQNTYSLDALTRLNPWPYEPDWYLDLRREYEQRFIDAVV